MSTTPEGPDDPTQPMSSAAVPPSDGLSHTPEPAVSEPPPAGPSRRRLWIAVAAVVAVLLAAVIALVATQGDDNKKPTAANASPSSSAATSSRPVSTTGLVHGDGFTLVLPSGWRQVPLQKKDLQAFLNGAAKDNPGLRQYLSGQAAQLAARNVSLFAVKGTTATSGFLTNINVLAVDAGGTPVEEAESAAKVQLGGAGATDLHSGSAHFPAGDAASLQYQLPIQSSGGGTVQVQGLQYYVEHGGKIYVFTLSTRSRSADQPAFDAMMQSLSFV